MQRVHRSICVAIALVALSVGFAEAQIPERVPDVPPRYAGPFVVYPLFSTTVESTDNLFRTASEPTSTTVVSIAPGVLAELPMRSSWLRLGYAVRYRDYGRDVEIDQKLSHFFRGDASLAFGSGVALEVTEDFQLGVLDTQALGLGGEVVFEGDEFSRSTTEVALSRTVSEKRRYVFSAVHDALKFDPNSSRSFFDRNEDALEVVEEYRSSGRLSLNGGIAFSREDLSRPETADNAREKRDVSGFRVSCGGRFEFGPGSFLDGSVNYAWTTFDTVLPLPSSSSFRGLLGQLNYVRFVPAGLRFIAAAGRDVYPSIFGDNKYYVNRQVQLRVEVDPRARVVAGVRGLYQENDYPEGRPSRKDSITEGRVWIGYRFRGTIDWQVYWNTGSRSSSAPSGDYDATSFGTAIRIGT